MKNITKNSTVSNQISLFLGQAFLLVCLMLVSFASAQTPEGHGNLHLQQVLLW